MWVYHFVTNFDSCMHLFLCQLDQNVHDINQRYSQLIHTVNAEWNSPDIVLSVKVKTS